MQTYIAQMHRNPPAGVLLLLTALFLVASASPAIIGHDAEAETGARFYTASWLLRRLEDDVRQELNLGSITYPVYNPNQQACAGPCPGRGKPYTGHGCPQIFQNRC
jgi:hypothetical protein